MASKVPPLLLNLNIVLLRRVRMSSLKHWINLLFSQLLRHESNLNIFLWFFKKVDENNMEAGKKLPLTDIGAGCYPTTIFFNHSCAPNTVRINMGKRVKYFDQQLLGQSFTFILLCLKTPLDKHFKTA